MWLLECGYVATEVRVCGYLGAGMWLLRCGYIATEVRVCSY